MLIFTVSVMDVRSSKALKRETAVYISQVMEWPK